jgi:hypothetical protein
LLLLTSRWKTLHLSTCCRAPCEDSVPLTLQHLLALSLSSHRLLLLRPKPLRVHLLLL